jgi:hypothetical protein
VDDLRAASVSYNWITSTSSGATPAFSNAVREAYTVGETSPG